MAKSGMGKFHIDMVKFSSKVIQEENYICIIFRPLEETAHHIIPICKSSNFIEEESASQEGGYNKVVENGQYEKSKVESRNK